MHALTQTRFQRVFVARHSDVNTTIFLIGWYPRMQRGSCATCWFVKLFSLTAELVVAVFRWSCLKIFSNLHRACVICNVAQSNEKYRPFLFENPSPVFGLRRRRLIPRVWVCSGLFVCARRAALGTWRLGASPDGRTPGISGFRFQDLRRQLQGSRVGVL